MFTPQQREEFDRSGIVCVPGAIASRDVAKMCDRVWNTLGRRFKTRRDAPSTWECSAGKPDCHDLPKAEHFTEIGSPAICEALDNLLGDGNWQRPERWGSLLVTFPESTECWNVPHKSWHLDFPAPSTRATLFAVRLSSCVWRVAAGQAGARSFSRDRIGSCRILADKEPAEKLRSAEAREGLIRDYSVGLKGLCSFDEEGRSRAAVH